VWIGFDWLRTGTGGGCCECGDEPSGSCATELVSLDIRLLPAVQIFMSVESSCYTQLNAVA
jgi:hypothetical protein